MGWVVVGTGVLGRLDLWPKPSIFPQKDAKSGRPQNSRSYHHPMASHPPPVALLKGFSAGSSVSHDEKIKKIPDTQACWARQYILLAPDSQKAPDFHTFTPSPGNSSIWRAQDATENQQIVTENRRCSQKIQGKRILGSATFQQNPKGYQNGWGIKMASFLIAENYHWEIKGRFRKRVVLANVPSFRFSFRGTCERTLIPVFVPGEHPNVPSFRFSFRGNIRQNHPVVNLRN